MALTLLKMQQHKHHTVFRSVTSRALPREPCRAAAARALSRVAKAYSEMPATPHVPPADHIAVPLPPPPSPPRPFPSPFPRAREEARAGRGGGRGGRRTPSPTPYATTSTPSSAKSRHAPVSPLRALTPCGRRSCRACCCF
jgi:hypothetical protein